jgi:hypothetical protein
VPNETIDEIVASAAEARKQLGKLEHQLQGEIDRIDLSPLRKSVSLMKGSANSAVS